ncbi:metallophosphoesterase family protein [Actibacterium sp. 188UL27-1]|uniref:purple acid phosphatase family protein n=1 Tax=Actibacterium sp. 188UL27-1 TaxID=2786961 RepID=UPI00195EC2A5|nr:metallophosphoesterase family protein [Actibacterium sp. 188UL27-1]MBM7070360.1 metallophosphoesterase family protein [Actibacterium sp. 188UL27-1]
MKSIRRSGFLAISFAAWTAAVTASADPIADTAEAIKDRFLQTLAPEEITDANPGDFEALLTEDERALFATGYITFTVDAPVTVYIFRDTRLDEVNEPFWLADQGFDRTDFLAEAYQRDFDVWRRDYPAGEIGLGIHALRVVREHYFIGVTPQGQIAQAEVANLAPDTLDTGPLERGALTYVDRSVTLDAVSPELEGMTLIRTPSDRRPAAAIYGAFHETDHRATAQPDQIFLTIAKDPREQMAVNWRTDISVTGQSVALWLAEQYNAPNRPEPQIFPADTVLVESLRVVNQTAIHRHSVLLHGLEPGTEYTYAVGSDATGWSSAATFETARSGEHPMSLAFIGDVQEGFDRFESVMDTLMRMRPDVDLLIFGGDLVSRGNDADQWDDFFAALGDAGRSIPIAPIAGNHEYLPDDDPAYYRATFRLPDNGPDDIPAGLAYHFEFGGNTFIMLDSNAWNGEQRDWLPTALQEADDDFSFVFTHHAAYTSRPGRYYGRITENWMPIWEQNDVISMVFQGHDHGYMRTYPMLNGEVSTVDDGGIYYVVSSAGEKFYEIDSHDYIELSVEERQMFQIIDVMRDDDRMIYRAYDVDGVEHDRVEIED